MTGGRWTGPDGWPCDFPPPLLDAIASLPGADITPADELARLARLIVAADDAGREGELPRARPATAASSDAELARLGAMCAGLADFIDTMRAPVIGALVREGARLPTLASMLRETAERAREAYGETGAPERSGGRPPKVAAAGVTRVAAEVFARVAMFPATFTTDPVTSEIKGVWPEFLAEVFAALGIDASVASQVKAHKSEN